MSKTHFKLVGIELTPPHIKVYIQKNILSYMSLNHWVEKLVLYTTLNSISNAAQLNIRLKPKARI